MCVYVCVCVCVCVMLSGTNTSLFFFLGESRNFGSFRVTRVVAGTYFLGMKSLLGTAFQKGQRKRPNRWSESGLMNCFKNGQAQILMRTSSFFDVYQILILILFFLM